MDKTKWFCETGSEGHTLKEEFIKAYNGKIYPATKEQCDTLEKAMAGAGYTSLAYLTTEVLREQQLEIGLIVDT